MSTGTTQLKKVLAVVETPGEILKTQKIEYDFSLTKEDFINFKTFYIEMIQDLERSSGLCSHEHTA